MNRRLAAYDFSAAAYAGSLTFEIGCNWKFAHENFIEPYHVFAAHPRLHKFVPMRERQPSQCDGALMWNSYRFKTAEEGRGSGLPHFPGLDEHHSMQGIWVTVFPCFGIEIYPDHVVVLQVQPVARDRSLERIAIYLIGEAADASHHERGRSAVFDMWQALNEEDIGLLRALQRGRAAPGFDGGILSPYWDEAPRHFSRLVAETVWRESRSAP